MAETTNIELKCECSIPFQTELVTCFDKLIRDSIPEEQLQQQVPHWLAIRQALHSKILFIKVSAVGKVKKWRPKLLAAAKRLLGKEFVGTIQSDDKDVTLILL